MEDKTPIKLRSFENCYPTILEEVQKRRHKWTLTSIASVSYEDVQQIILLHIWKKWSLYDQSRPLLPFLNILISNQIKNLIRNLYSNFSRPCLKCEASVGSDGCKIYTLQCEDCPLYTNWKKRKEPATNIKLPLSIENHTNEINTIFDSSSDISCHINQAHVVMKKILKPIEYKIYEGLFILHESESVVAKRLGYISNETKRAPGYKQIRNIRKSIIAKFKRSLAEGLIDIY
jgi:hypothetical protein